MNHLSRLAADVLLKTAKKKKIKIGIFTALHTFGQSLNWNTHVHLSVTRGGLSKCKTTWKKVYFTRLCCIAQKVINSGGLPTLLLH
ncbi:transposase [Piscirickettsia salmonis]